ncbi:histidine phosphatase family protein [Corynebacterium alimapuense]|uniref:Histidine phosphatase family protein n=1 Tax=Corynebacterium alimapuense TaxID=1576874 RepID=A0A3M8K9W2_9CORY|nr:histidine phosphatase family protein [Corynebacterium alimapuense]RNE50007.1 histidine phosphatase family protein [Corynebacterium alimapuense]
MAGRLILLRHGQTHSNVKHILDTRPPGAELTELGRSQASQVGLELAEYCGVGEGSSGRLSTVACSIALRAQQTAVLAMSAFEQAAGLPERSMQINVIPGIQEIFAGDHELLGDEHSLNLYTDALWGWLSREEAARMPGGENYLDLLGRYQPMLENLVAEHLSDGQDEDVLVVSHGTAIRTIAAHAASIDPDFAFAGYLGNCRFVVLEPGQRPFGQWEMVRWADLDRQL